MMDAEATTATNTTMEGAQAPHDMVSVSLEQDLQDESSATMIDHIDIDNDNEHEHEPLAASESTSSVFRVKNPCRPLSSSAIKEAAAATEASAISTTTTEKDETHHVSWMTHEERDELAALTLRFSFQHKTIGKVYYALTRAGWVYYAGERRYLPPDSVDSRSSETLMTANEVAEHLDYYSLEECLVSDLQIPTNQQQQQLQNADMPRLLLGQEARWRKLRDDAVYHFFVADLGKRGRWKLSEVEKENNSTGQNNDATDVNVDEEKEKDAEEADSSKKGKQTKHDTATSAKNNTKKKKTSAVPKRTQPRRGGQEQSDNNKESVTTADVGADMFMKRGSIQAKHNARKKSFGSKAIHTSTASMEGMEEDEESVSPFERLSLEECRNMLEDPKQAQAFDYQEIMDDPNEIKKAYKEQFKEWRFLLATNHSILLYGYGSKLNLLNVFAEKQLSKEGYVVVLNGFDPDISAESILDLLVELFLDGLEPAPLEYSLPGFEDQDAAKITTLHKDQKTNKVKQVVMRKIRDPVERSKAIAGNIAKAQAKELYPIFLIVHNLEGAGLRNRLAQEILSTLVANGKVEHSGVNSIRLVASVDHVDAPAVLWSVHTSAQYRWMWKEMHTHQPYVDELVMLEQDEINTSNSKKRRASAGGSRRQQKALIMDGEGADRVMEVLRNLATRYTEVMQNLATLQLEAPGLGSDPQKIRWVDSAHLLQQCLNKCTVKCDSQLRTFLGELEDHELVVVQKQGATSIVVRIPYSDEKLHEILAYRQVKH